jgi:hypothetical protein
MNNLPSPSEVQRLCRKFGITAKRPLTETELNNFERGKQTRKTAPKKNRYLP